jgi:serine phosphatase RsbU (regulator of sigma subunit)
VVSGDFHWQYRDKQYDFIAAVDCTGHGVPGALMSMIGHQMLNHVVIEEQILEPADILTELDEQVSLALKQDKEVMVRDGMDMVLCRIDREKKQMCFSGAYRPLFHVHGNEVSEYETDRIPVGHAIVDRPGHSFTQTCVQYSTGDTIYLTSDGYYDQFGGKSGKKMMKSNFKNLLAQIGSLPIDEQYRKMTEYLEEWQGNEDQVDDILVIGIQF